MPSFLPLPSCRPARLRLAGGAFLTSAFVVGGLLVAGPANATPTTTATSVSDKASLADALTQGDTSIVADADIPDSRTDSASDNAPATPANSHITLDVHGKQIVLNQIRVGAGATLTITDSTIATGDYYVDDGSGLDLHAEDLASPHAAGIEIGDGATVTVTHALVNAQGGDDGAGIGSAAQDTTGGGHFIAAEGAFVYAYGGDGGAGIGGGAGAAAVDVTVDSSEVSGTGGTNGAGIGSGDSGTGGGLRTASSSMRHAEYAGDSDYPLYASITAQGGDGAAGIGGGLHAAGSTVEVTGSVTATAAEGDPVGTTSAKASAIGFGQDSSGVFGALDIAEDATVSVRDTRTLRVPSGTTVHNSGTINLMGGAITGGGIVANNGDIRQQTADGDDAPYNTDAVTGVTVTGNNYAVTLDPNGGTSTGPSSLQLYSRQLDTYALDRPTSSDSDLTFFRWNTQSDGQGEDPDYGYFGSSSTGTSTNGTPVPVTIYASYGVAPRFTSDSLPAAQVNAPYDQALPVAGDTNSNFGYYIDGYDDNGDPIPTLPAGLTLDEDTGRITGTPTEAGTFQFHLYVYYGHFSTDQMLTLRVTAASAPVSPAPVITNTNTNTTSGTTAPTAGQPVSSPSAASSPAPAQASTQPAPAPAPAPSAPTLAAVAKTTVKFGHTLNLAVTASSTVPVTFSAKGDLPKGITLNAKTGLISGVAAEVGTFTATVTATSSAGSAHAEVTITVPAIQELIDSKPVPAVKAGAGSVPVQVSGLKKGEHWRVQVDGKTVKTGTMKRAGALKASIALKKATHDTVHHITISTNRAVKDPATRAATEITVTSLAAKKTLAAKTSVDTHGHVTVAVSHLAAHEAVVVKDKGKTVAKGKADAAGRFSAVTKKLGKGLQHLTVRGATAGRKGSVTVHH